MAVTGEMVKELRASTGAGILDCKKALEEADGDMAKATELLQKRNQAVAVKKMGRDAKDGKVAAWTDGRVGVLAEINSETDFVARSDAFVKFVGDVVAHIAAKAPTCVEGEGTALLDQAFEANGGRSLRESIADVVGRVGENLRIRRFERYAAGANGRVGVYVHGEGRIGVMVEVEADQAGVADTDDVKALVKELYLQVAAMSPLVVGRGDLPADVLAKQREIALAQLGDISKKPPQIQEKILEGKLGKWFAEVCLLEQVYIRDDTKKVQDVVAETGRKAGATLTVRRFARYALGEGL